MNNLPARFPWHWAASGLISCLLVLSATVSKAAFDAPSGGVNHSINQYARQFAYPYLTGAKQWQKSFNQSDARLSLEIHVFTASPSFTVRLADKQVTTQTPTGYGEVQLNVRLTPYKNYSLIIEDLGIIEAYVYLTDLQEASQIVNLALPGKENFKQYDLFVDGGRLYLLSYVHNYTGENDDFKWEFEVRERSNPQFKLEDDFDLSGKPPGTGEWLSMGPGKSANPAHCALSWSVSLGNRWDGSSAGELCLSTNALSPAVYTPAALYHSTKLPEGDMIDQLPPYLDLPQTRVEMVTEPSQPWWYELRFFRPNPAAGESPFVVWRIENPDQNPQLCQKLKITELRNGEAYVNLAEYIAASNTWRLTRGKLGGQQRVETRTLDINFPSRIETVEIKYENDTWSHQYVETYESRSQGYYELVSTVVNPGGANLSTTFNYTTSAYGEDRLDYVMYPDGFWEKRLYPYGYMDSVLYPWMDQPAQPTPNPAGCKYVYYLFNNGLLEATTHQYVIDDSHRPVLRMEAYDPLESGPNLSIAETRLLSPQVSGRMIEGTRTKRYLPGVFLNVDVSYHLASRVKSRSPAEYYNYAFGGYNASAKAFTPAVWDFYDTDFLGAVALISKLKTQADPVSAYLWNERFSLSTRQILADPSAPLANQIAALVVEFNSVLVGDVIYTADRFQAVVLSAKTQWVLDAWLLGSAVDTRQLNRLLLQDAYPVELAPRQQFAWLMEKEFRSYTTDNSRVPLQTWKETTILVLGFTVQEEKHVWNGSQWFLVDKRVHENDVLGHRLKTTRVDPATELPRIVYEANWTGPDDKPGDLLRWSLDEQGVKTTYQYDSFKRISATVKQGIPAQNGYAEQKDITNSFAYNVLNNVTSESTSAPGLTLTQTRTYYPDGRLQTETDAAGLTTTYTYPTEFGGRRVVKTLPNNTTEITEYYQDRRLKSITGSAVVPELHRYFAKSAYPGWDALPDNVRNSGAHVAEIEEVFYGPAGINSPQKKLLGRDVIGRVVWTLDPGPQVHLTECLFGYADPSAFATINGIKVTDSPLVRLEFDPFFRTNRQGLLINSESTWWTPLTPASQDRIQDTDVAFYQDPATGYWYERTESSTYLTDNSPAKTILHTRLEQLTGLPDNVLSVIKEIDQDNQTTLTTVSVDRPNKKVTTTVNPPGSNLDAVQITVNGLLVEENSDTVANRTKYYYDTLGRQIQVLSPLGFSTYTCYNSAGQVQSTKDPAGNQTDYAYYPPSHANAGLLQYTSLPGGKRTYQKYNSRAQLTHTWGHVPYPEERVYDDFGQMIELKTYRNPPQQGQWTDASWPTSPGVASTTTWQYHPNGLLAWKKDDQNCQVTYTYDDAYRTTQIKWHRTENNQPVTVDYEYALCASGVSHLDLVSIDLSNTPRTGNPTPPPDIVYSNYDRRGLPRAVTDDSGVHTLAYDDSGRLLSDSIQNGWSLVNTYTPPYGRTSLSLTLPGLSALVYSYGYDSVGRFETVSDGTYSATYGYLANSDLVENLKSKKGAGEVLNTTKTYQYGFRLGSISSLINGGGNVSAHSYLYDALNRRTQATLNEGSYWQYGYNDRSELTSAKRYWIDTSLVAGQQYQYGYDQIGNRSLAKWGGDPNGTQQRESLYTANSLNQYSSRTMPDSLDLIGTTDPTATVTIQKTSTIPVTGVGTPTPTFRKGEYFCGEGDADGANANGPACLNLSLVGLINQTSTDVVQTQDRRVILPPAQQTFTYDADGNLTSDGLWQYEWDTRNRLIKMTSLLSSSMPNTLRQLLEFTYDHIGRRASKTVKTWNGSSYANPVTVKFVYDGWNLIAVLNSSLNLQTSFLWGLDLSGFPPDTEQAAGGIGGLLMVTSHAAPATHHFTAYDGNGNITALVNADSVNKDISAQYEYSPYGELIRITGSQAQANPFRWSTKYWDNETDLVEYGYRYYSPSLGRWLSRDPIEEEGGVNLYAFCRNNGINSLDLYGKAETEAEQSATMGGISALAAEGGAAAMGILQRVQQYVNANNTMAKLGEALNKAATVAGSEIEMVEAFLVQQRAMVSSMANAAGGRVTTILGRFDTDMVNFFNPSSGKLNQWGQFWQQAGHNILSMPTLSREGQLLCNFRWLAEAYARNDRIILRSEIGMEIGTGTYELELLFLRALGCVRIGNEMVH